MSGESKTKARKRAGATRLDVWVPAALKRDVIRIAKFEGRALSRMSAGLIRLGIERYFEMADAARVAPVRALMQDLFHEDVWIPDTPPPPQSEATKIDFAKRARGRENRDQFDAAIEEGLRNFETASR